MTTISTSAPQTSIASGWRKVQKTPQIKLSMGGETFSGTARFLTDRAEHDRNLQGSGNDPPECCPGKPSCHPAYDALVNK